MKIGIRYVVLLGILLIGGVIGIQLHEAEAAGSKVVITGTNETVEVGDNISLQLNFPGVTLDELTFPEGSFLTIQMLGMESFSFGQQTVGADFTYSGYVNKNWPHGPILWDNLKETILKDGLVYADSSEAVDFSQVQNLFLNTLMLEHDLRVWVNDVEWFPSDTVRYVQPGDRIKIQWFTFNSGSRTSEDYIGDEFAPSNQIGGFPAAFKHVNTVFSDGAYQFEYEVQERVFNGILEASQAGITAGITIEHNWSRSQNLTFYEDDIAARLSDWNIAMNWVPYEITVDVESDVTPLAPHDRQVIVTVDDPEGVEDEGSTVYYKWVKESVWDDIADGYNWNNVTGAGAFTGQPIPVPALDFPDNGNYILLIRAVDEHGSPAHAYFGPYRFEVNSSDMDIVVDPQDGRYQVDVNTDPEFALLVSSEGSPIVSVSYRWDAGASTAVEVEAGGESAVVGMIQGLPAPEGSHVLQVSVQNLAGVELSESFTYVRDGTAPEITFSLAGDAGTLKHAHSVTTTVSTPEADDSYTAFVAWTTSAAPPDSSSELWSELEAPTTTTPTGGDGSWYLHVKAVDEAGNERIETASDGEGQPFNFQISSLELETITIDGEAPACESSDGLGTLSCSDAVTVDPTPMKLINFEITVDGKSGAELDNYDIESRIVESAEIDPTLFMSGPSAVDGVISVTSLGHTGTRYLLIKVTDPFGDRKWFLSHGFVLDPNAGGNGRVKPLADNDYWINTTEIGVRLYYFEGGLEIKDQKIAYSIDNVNWTELTIPTWGVSDDLVYLPNHSMATAVLALPEDLEEKVGYYELYVRFYDEDDTYVSSSFLFYYDATAPVITEVTFDPAVNTAGSVTATVHFTDNQPPYSGTKEQIFTVNGSMEVTVQDLAGNTASTIVEVDWIVAEYTISYAPAPGAWTNQNVIATVNFFDPVTLDGAGEAVQTANYEFTENGSYSLDFTYEDESAGSVLLNVDWIDKTPPTGTIFYEAGESVGITAKLVATDNTGAAPIVVDAEGVELDESGWTHNFLVNGEHTFYFKDAAGNINSVTAVVTQIDSVPPVLTLTYSKTELTNSVVRATVSADEPITVINNGGSHYYNFEGNGEFTFIVRDRYGNESSITAVVDNIDTDAPVPLISYSTTSPTNGDVIATISANEDFSVLNNRGRTNYVFMENGSFTFIIEDMAGNLVEVIATVSNIDKTKVEYDLVYSTEEVTANSVTVTVVPRDGKVLTYLNNGGSPSVTFERNGIVWLNAVDELDNSYVIEIAVTHIDKESPIITYTGDLLVAWNGTLDPLVDITVMDTYSGDLKAVTTYIDNVDLSTPGEYEVTYSVIDEAGNTATRTRKVHVVGSTELSLYVNNARMSDNRVNVIADQLKLDVFGTAGEWELYGAYGLLWLGDFKSGGLLLDGLVLNVDRQGYYTILIRDQERNQQLVQIYVIPSSVMGE